MDNRTTINNALEYISRVWNSEELTLEKVAEQAGFSVHYFDRLFAEATGKSVMEYVRVYKLTRSAMMLRTSDRSILDIALELGYANPENFARAFRAHYGQSPSEYRASHRHLALTWTELSTGTVAKRFENACPEFQRADPDELIDYLETKDPVKYCTDICGMKLIDSTVYRLSGDSDYVSVEEYRQDEMALTFYCSEEKLRAYVQIAKRFPKYIVSFTCGNDFILPPDRYGFEKDTLYELYDYIYLAGSVEPVTREGYHVRELAVGDESGVKALSDNKLTELFEHIYKRGCESFSRMIGLFSGDKLIGCAVPTIEEARSIRASDIGGLFFLPGHNTALNREILWTHVIGMALAEERLPTNTATRDDGGESARMGYTLVARRYAFTNF
jgi:AraC-like DNA-binding protein